MSRRAALAVSLALVAAGCTPATGDPTPEAQPGPDPVVAQRYALERTVGYVDRWARQYLADDLAAAHRTGPIPAEAWQRALRRAAGGAAGVHLGCASAAVTVVKPGVVGISLTECAYPGGSSGGQTLRAVQGCFVPVPPSGSVDEFVHQQLGGGAPAPAFVDSAAKAGPGNWYVGACA